MLERSRLCTSRDGQQVLAKHISHYVQVHPRRMYLHIMVLLYQRKIFKSSNSRYSLYQQNHLKCEKLKMHHQFRLTRFENSKLQLFTDASFSNLPNASSQADQIIGLIDPSNNSCPIYWNSSKIEKGCTI